MRIILPTILVAIALAWSSHADPIDEVKRIIAIGGPCYEDRMELCPKRRDTRHRLACLYDREDLLSDECRDALWESDTTETCANVSL